MSSSIADREQSCSGGVFDTPDWNSRVIHAIHSIQTRFIEQEDPCGALRLLLDGIIGLTGSESGIVAMIEGDYRDQSNIIVVSQDIQVDIASEYPQATQTSGVCMIDQVQEAGGVLICNNLEGNSRGYRFSGRGGQPIRSCLLLPLQAGEHLLGVVGVIDRLNGYDQRMADALEPVCQAAAILIKFHNAQRRHKGVERALSVGEQLRRSILDSALDCIIATDSVGHIIEFNPAAERTFGWTRAEILGLKISEALFTDAERHDSDKLFRQPHSPMIKNDRIGHHFETQSRRRNGEEFPIELAITKAEIEGEIIFTSCCRDITERKLRVEELRQAKELAEESSKSKSTFVATVSHEIRTPLSAIRGALELLNGAHLTEQEREFLTIAQGSNDALLTIVNDILDFAKVEAGKIELELAEVVPGQLINGVARLLELQTQRHDATISTFVAAAVPATVITDEGRLRQVLINLVTNAIKHASGGNVRISVTADGAFLRFEVADDGSGIPQAEQSKLFHEYSQISTAKEPAASGHGLGLTISERIVDLLGGRIGFSSLAGVGTRFWFTIPQHSTGKSIASARTRIGQPDEQAPPPNREALRGLRVLLAEDSRANRVVGAAMLAKYGLVVDTVRDGREAVAGVRRSHYDFVLMDLDMPEMDGIEATAQIRALVGERGKIPIIAVTAHVIEGTRAACLASGMDDFISKPIDEEAVLGTLVRCLQKLRDSPSTGGDGRLATAENWLDLAALKRLAADTSKDLVPRMVDIFIEELHEQAAMIKAAASTSDIPVIERASHIMKSSASTFGVYRVRSGAEQLNVACKADDSAGAMKLVDRLLSDITPSINALQDNYGLSGRKQA